MPLFIFFCLLFSSLSAESIAEISPYPAFCLRAATEENVFRTFKQQPVYQQILEHVSFKQGKKYLKIIETKYPFILKHLEGCRKNDSLGSPQTHSYGSRYGTFSPTTLRYMKVAAELISHFKPLNNQKIIEIGGGYGGQCFVLSVLTPFKHYTLLDLKEPALLTRKYLDRLGVKNTSCISNKEFQGEEEYDLVISNYAFSEISKEEQQVYIEKILNRSKRGYLTYNFISSEFGIKSFGLEELLPLLKKPSRKLEVLPETPQTGPSVLIVWQE